MKIKRKHDVSKEIGLNLDLDGVFIFSKDSTLGVALTHYEFKKIKNFQKKYFHDNREKIKKLKEEKQSALEIEDEIFRGNN